MTSSPSEHDKAVMDFVVRVARARAELVAHHLVPGQLGVEIIVGEEVWETLMCQRSRFSDAYVLDSDDGRVTAFGMPVKLDTLLSKHEIRLRLEVGA